MPIANFVAVVCAGLPAGGTDTRICTTDTTWCRIASAGPRPKHTSTTSSNFSNGQWTTMTDYTHVLHTPVHNKGAGNTHHCRYVTHWCKFLECCHAGSSAVVKLHAQVLTKRAGVWTLIAGHSPERIPSTFKLRRQRQ